MASSETDSSRSKAWAWPVGILVGLAIGIPVFGSSGGVAFGVAIGVAFAIAFGATSKRTEAPAAHGDPDGDTSSTGTGPAGPSTRDNPDGSTTGGDADGPDRG
ncbi:hypothetical protein OG470_12185 [Micromonospora sp. NBC_00389]|uniref:hypothetical protein n=1 Tax=Micromonospora sp. NBC_00389 TaxID=2903586 RepID=UPI002E209CB5